MSSGALLTSGAVLLQMLLSFLFDYFFALFCSFRTYKWSQKFCLWSCTLEQILAYPINNFLIPCYQSKLLRVMLNTFCSNKGLSVRKMRGTWFEESKGLWGGWCEREGYERIRVCVFDIWMGLYCAKVWTVWIVIFFLSDSLVARIHLIKWISGVSGVRTLASAYNNALSYQPSYAHGTNCDTYMQVKDFNYF